MNTKIIQFKGLRVWNTWADKYYFDWLIVFFYIRSNQYLINQFNMFELSINGLSPVMLNPSWTMVPNSNKTSSIYRGGFEGVAWGLPEGWLRVGWGKPLRTLRKPSGKTLEMLTIHETSIKAIFYFSELIWKEILFIIPKTNLKQRKMNR